MKGMRTTAHLLVILSKGIDMTNLTFNINFDEELFGKFEKEYIDGNFSGAIKTSILYLTECIRERTDLDLDGDKLITKTFSSKNPLIKFNNLSTQSEIDEQTGHMMVLQGIYKGIRNPRNHNLKNDDRQTCDSILTLINSYVMKIKKAKFYFDYNDFIEILNDPHFDRSIEYSDEILKMIPRNKLLDTNIVLLKNVKRKNYLNISYIILSSINALKEDELKKLFSHCSKILQKTDNYSMIKALVFAFKDKWKDIDKVSRIRIENILMKALSNLAFEEHEDIDDYGNNYSRTEINEDGQLSVYLRHIPIPYSKKIPPMFIHSKIETKLGIGGNYSKFILKNFHSFIFKDHEYLNACYNDTIVKLLRIRDKYIYEELTSGSFNNGDYEPYYRFDVVVHDEIKKYQTIIEQQKIMDDDIPF